MSRDIRERMELTICVNGVPEGYASYNAAHLPLTTIDGACQTKADHPDDVVTILVTTKEHT